MKRGKVISGGWGIGLVWALGMACVALPARAVIFYSTDDPTYNTTAPTGSLAGSGWQWVGQWDGFQGTPIGPHHFLAAQHIGGTVGDTFTFAGAAYTTTAYFDDPATDLRIWEVSGTFPMWAPLYRGNGEVGSPLTVFGCGLSRGTAVYVDEALKGWLWGGNSGPLRWGTNLVYGIVNGGPNDDFLYAVFSASTDPNWVHLARGDSSGPIFINDGTGWKLAGVAYAVDGPFNDSDSGPGFDGAFFDARGLYEPNGEGGWQLISGPAPIPSGFYATRVSTRATWIDSIVPDPSTTADTPLLPAWELDCLALLLVVPGGLALQLGRVQSAAR